MMWIMRKKRWTVPSRRPSAKAKCPTLMGAWRAACWPTRAQTTSPLTQSASACVGQMASGLLWDSPVGGLCRGLYVKVCRRSKGSLLVTLVTLGPHMLNWLSWLIKTQICDYYNITVLFSICEPYIQTLSLSPFVCLSWGGLLWACVIPAGKQ